MLKSETKVIGNGTYTVTQLPFSKGRQMLVRLTKTLGPVLAKFLEGGGKGDTQTVSAGIEVLAKQLTDEDLAWVCKVFGEYSTVRGEDGHTKPLDEKHQEFHFAANYEELFKWLVFAIEVNYSDFFGVTSLFGKGAAPADKAAEAA